MAARSLRRAAHLLRHQRNLDRQQVIFQTLLAPATSCCSIATAIKSVHHGVVLSGARPVCLDSSVNTTYGLFGPVPKKTLFAAIEASRRQGADPHLLHLRRPALRPAAHHRGGARQGIKVIIDEAWYAHARFHPAFRPTALEAGADYPRSRRTRCSRLSQPGEHDPRERPGLTRTCSARTSTCTRRPARSTASSPASTSAASRR